MLIGSCINIGPKKEGKIMNTNTSFCMQIEEEKKAFEEKRCASSFVDQTGCYF
jgi:hypothetical protein